MSDDPYKVLGVAKTATQAEIKKAYRKLAKTLHPDLNAGDAAKAEQFARVSAAYDILGDEDKRRRFDAGEIDASGQERPERQFYRQHADADAQGRYRSSAGYGDFGSFSDIFSDLFRSRGGGGAGGAHPGAGPGGGQGFAARGADLRYQMEVDFLEAARGAKKTVTMPDGNRIEISVPPGLRDGQSLRLRGKGQAGPGGGPAGDAHVSVSVRPHAVFRRDGNDIEIDLPVTFDEAVLGAKVEVPTISGTVSMQVPPGTSSGERLRLKGRGIAPPKGTAGDQYVRVQIMLAGKPDEAMQELAKRWRASVSHDPRAGLRRNT